MISAASGVSVGWWKDLFHGDLHLLSLAFPRDFDSFGRYCRSLNHPAFFEDALHSFAELRGTLFACARQTAGKCRPRVRLVLLQFRQACQVFTHRLNLVLTGRDGQAMIVFVVPGFAAFRFRMYLSAIGI